MKNRKKLLTISILCITTVLSACSVKDKAETKNTGVTTNVTVFTVSKDNIDETLSYTGEIAASESTAVSAKASGEAQTVYVKEGDFVNAGDTLLAIDSTPYRLSYNQALAALNSANASQNSAKASYNSATGGTMQQNLAQLEASLAAAKIAYDNALDNFNKQKVLFDIGAISQMEFNSYQTQLDNAKLNLNTAQTNYDLTKNVVQTESKESAKASVDMAASQVQSAKAQLDIAKYNLDNCTVTAPISGYISAKNVNKGQMVGQGSVVFTITNTKNVDAIINVTESVIPYITLDTKSYITVKSADLENIEGTVTQINPVKSASSGLYNIKISIDNQEGILKEGMIADVKIVTQSQKNSVVIPSDCLIQEEGGYYVYIAKDGKAHRQDVEIGIENGEYTQILSGLNVKDKVVVKGKDYLSEKNNKIKIVEE